MTQPGERIRSIASRVFGPETMARVIDPIVADLQCEYGEAFLRGTFWRARLSLVRSYLGLGLAVMWLAIRYLGDPRRDNPGFEVARAWSISVLALAILTVALIIPPLLSWHGWHRDPLFGAFLSVTLVPQALPLSIPAGLCVGVLWVARGKVVTWQRLCAVLTFAIAFTAVVWTVLEWMMPQASQMFREIVAARAAGEGRLVTFEPGLNELGLSHLGRRSDPAAVRQFHLLWALCFAAAPLTLFSCGLAPYVHRAGSALALAMALPIAYIGGTWVMATIATVTATPPVVQAWIPNTVFLLVACALLRAES